MKIQGNIVDIPRRSIFFGEVSVKEGRILDIQPLPGSGKHYIIPGFIDAHIHIESSMLVPSEFAKLALPHGTVATVSDPHEIANVLGAAGTDYMINDGLRVPLKFYFGASSCVPATCFETAGVKMGPEEVGALLARDEIKYLSEVMNYPGVINQDPEVLKKISVAKSRGKPIDGHAPGLMGKASKAYFAAGITTDHECISYEEGRGKARLGVIILIREGSAAKNFEALIPLLPEFPDQVMFCSDDRHPDDLLEGHINTLVRRAVEMDYDVFQVLQAACINPVQHYDLEVGLLRVGDPADFLLVEDLRRFNVLETYIEGQLVASNGSCDIEAPPAATPNCFNVQSKTPQEFQIEAKGSKIRVMQAIDGELITKSFIAPAKIENNLLVSDPEADILKLFVINRYHDAEPAAAFINNFGIKKGAIASSVGHDSHNILAVGADDDSICQAINLIINSRGGISAVCEETQKLLPLPVAGIMSNMEGKMIAKEYKEINLFVKEVLGSTLKAPFMTLSFMALLVIPELKLSDKGLFNGQKFQFSSIFADNPV